MELIPFNTTRALPGDRFGKLVVERTGKTARGAHYAECRCDCGSVSQFAQLARLVSGEKTSCGCDQDPINFKHGLARTPLYSRWCGMMRRCHTPDSPGFENYGGRGISVCERWHDPRLFCDDVSAGFSPDLHIDRIDNDGNYEPGNVRWVKPTRNLYNRRVTRTVTYDGRTLNLDEWSAETGIPARLIAKRVFERGWPAERALTEPALSKTEAASLANAAMNRARKASR